MKAYQTAFIELALELGVLKFGEFELKSGRISPYFFNAGLFNTGAALDRLGAFYAQAIMEAELEFDVLFGPAYKGIPLGTATVVALQRDFQRNTPFAFNRKEKKAHGEGGQLVGAPLQGKILVVDDVITAGTAIRESVAMIQAEDAEFGGVVIALDRREKGKGELSAIQEVEAEFNVPVVSIVSLDDVLSYLRDSEELQQWLPKVAAYRAEYGV